MKSFAPEALFGTDGIRGCFGQFPMTEEVAFLLGQAVCYEMEEGVRDPLICIGRDTRGSGPLLEQALVQGIEQVGGKVYLLGILPTPAIAWLGRSLGALASIVISASHNPYQDNGLKVFQGKGLKCSDAMELRLARRILHLQEERAFFLQKETNGNFQRQAVPEAVGKYSAWAVKTLAKDLDLQGFTLAVDGANGAAYLTTPLVLRELGAKVKAIHCEPDGKNINEHCGSTFPEVLAAWTKESGADVGIAHDGDADRVLLCDEKGHVLDGDELLAILALDMKEQGVLRGNAVVATVMSNLGLDDCLGASGIEVHRTQVGDRYVIEGMQKCGSNLGGESSGHLILSDWNPTGDGLCAALQVLRVLCRRGEPLSVVRTCMQKYPQLLINEAVREKRPFADIPQLEKEMNAVRTALGAEGRFLLRYSGTENKVRLLLEAKKAKGLDAHATRLLTPIRSCIGSGS